MNGVTPEQLINTVAVLLAVFAAIITVDKVIDIFKKWRAPSTDMAQMLQNDKARLDSHEKAIHSLQESNQITLAALMALLDHELHNGNSDQMQKVRDDIMTYLQKNVVKS